jgi:phenylacetic acid degradation protein
MCSERRKIYSINGVVPVVEPTAFVHPDAVIIGDVIVGAGCYVGPGASLRGDFGRIIIGQGSNVQDNCTLHSLPGSDLVVEPGGHIAHGAIVHSARIGRNVMVGMNSVVMDHAVIGESSLIAAMSFVKAGAEIPARRLVAGIPAKVVRELTEDEIAMKEEGTRQYQQLTRRCLVTLVAVEPMTHVNPDRRRADIGIATPLRERAKRKDI